MTDQGSYPRPAELEDRLDDLMEHPQNDAEEGSPVSTGPNETPAEHEPFAIADSDHRNDPSGQTGGGQTGG